MSETYCGKPCARGHTRRYVSSKACVVCSRKRKRLAYRLVSSQKLATRRLAPW